MAGFKLLGVILDVMVVQLRKVVFHKLYSVMYFRLDVVIIIILCFPLCDVPTVALPTPILYIDCSNYI